MLKIKSLGPGQGPEECELEMFFSTNAQFLTYHVKFSSNK